MIYLIRSFGRGRKSLLKVGWTEDKDARMSKYKIDNPFFEFLSFRQGDHRQEKILHLYLTARQLKADILDEWFLDSPLTLSEFHVSWRKAERLIWRERSSLFTALDFARDNIKCRVYEDLRFLHRHEHLDREEIDIAWKKNSLKKIIKNHDLQRENRLFEASGYSAYFKKGRKRDYGWDGDPDY